MEYLKLQNSDLTVSRLCMGGCPMGGYGWGNVQQDELTDAVHTALDAGINFFDTADTYGLGQSERTLAAGLEARRKDVVIETKFGVRVENGKTFYDNSPQYIKKALEGSLRRLKTDYIDIYIIHYRDGRTPLEEVVEKLKQLQKEGKIRYFGLSNVHGDLSEYFPLKGNFVCCQNEYSLACRKYENDLQRLEWDLAVTPMSWGSLGQGILTGKYTKDNICFASDDRRSREIYVNFHGKKLEQNLQIVEALKQVASSHGKSVAACAIRFILDRLPASVVLAGIKRPSQLLSNTEAFGWHLTEEELQLLENVSK